MQPKIIQSSVSRGSHLRSPAQTEAWTVTRVRRTAVQSHIHFGTTKNVFPVVQFPERACLLRLHTLTMAECCTVNTSHKRFSLEHVCFYIGTRMGAAYTHRSLCTDVACVHEQKGSRVTDKKAGSLQFQLRPNGVSKRPHSASVQQHAENSWTTTNPVRTFS
ncbi:hypothetical protein FQA47_016239 [Oryzias melastigma]|uniref:Uncharacterized protein n=1 Tax=Oryzias melastigma TaxID=30732 RepID=A0A834C8T8_ORYME|nr:hypothetical protein FQA47_016239 [Oryzias melastigma]